ncbi:MAG: hypothetical protein WA765_04335 [Candidatus Acidiferrum sp.]
MKLRWILASLLILALGGVGIFLFRGSGTGSLPSLRPGTKSASTIPLLSVETEVSLQYEQFKGPIYGMPSAPNIWRIQAKIVNGDARPMEVLPVYMYTEAQMDKSEPVANFKAICPSSYVTDFSKTLQDQLITAPDGLGSEVLFSGPLPDHQLNEPHQNMFDDGIGVLIGVRGPLPAMLSADSHSVTWRKLTVAPRSTFNVSWASYSYWAAPDKVRIESKSKQQLSTLPSGLTLSPQIKPALDSAFEIVHLGPVARPVSSSDTETYLVVAKLNYTPTNKGGRMDQSSFQLIKITPTLSHELASSFPLNHSSMQEFGDAVLKMTSNQSQR